MSKRTLFCIFCLLSLILSGCTNKTISETAENSLAETYPFVETAPSTEATLPTETVPVLSEAELLLSQMTLREKVGQLFITRMDALDPNRSLSQVHDTVNDGITVLSEEIIAHYQIYPISGVIHFAGNIVSPQQITELNRQLAEMASIPLLICVDEEGGVVARLAKNANFDVPTFYSAGYTESTYNAALARGRAIGEYLQEYGFHVDFAPVADVNTNPQNTVIGKRAFSSDPATAAMMSGAFRDGLTQHGIIATFKHFPGHGDTYEDSHYGLAFSYKTAEEMALCEWIPFQAATSSDFIMTGHIAAPNITGNQLPATFSYQMITEILKGELGFSGLVITDSMQMAAITDEYSSSEAAILALQAGCDIILMPEDLEEAFDGVVAAVEDGRLSKQWLDETVLRILEFKISHGLWN